MPTYHFRWILILLLLLAWGLRVVDIDRDSLWLDEGLTPERSGYTIPKILANEVDIQGFPTQDTHPPFYYLVIKGTRAVFGTSDFAYRFPSAIFGLLLIAVMAKLGALLGGKPTALVAALITALSPFQIAYSQEARMYTLLILLVAVGLLALLKVESGKWKVESESASVLRTPYSILLLLSFILSIYTQITAVFIVGFLVLYGLWLFRDRKEVIFGVAVIVVSAIPLALFAVPRLFSSAEEALYTTVSPFTIFYDLVRGFWGGISAEITSPATQLISLLILGILIYAFTQTKHKLILAIFLLAVPLTMILLMPIKPTYAVPRHLSASYPAYALMAALGITRLKPRVSIITTLILLAGMSWSLQRFTTLPQYAKQDHRGLIAYIEQHAKETDSVLYSNAVLLPLWNHYQTRDLPVTSLPPYPHAASEFTHPEIQAVADASTHIWYMADQPFDGRDPDRIVQNWLDSNLYSIDQTQFSGENAVMRVDLYRANQFLPNFTIQNNTLWFDQDALPPNETTTFNLAGKTFEDYVEPSPDGTTHHRIPIPYGLPPADYLLTINDKTLATIPVKTAGQLPSTFAPSKHPDTRFLGWSSPAPTVRPGNPLPLTTYWQTDQPTDIPYTLTVTGLRVDTHTINFQDEGYLGRAIAHDTAIYTPPDTSPGIYTLHLTTNQQTNKIGTIQVEAWPLITDLPSVDNLVEKVDNSFGDAVQLAAYTADYDKTTGDLRLTLYWRVLNPPPNKSVFIHITDDITQPPSAQASGVPARNARPTSGWRVGEIIEDPYLLNTKDLNGTFSVTVGFFESGSGVRLPVIDQNNEQPFGQLELFEITLP